MTEVARESHRVGTRPRLTRSPRKEGGVSPDGSRPPVRTIGATYLGADRTRFRVWAPRRARVAVRLLSCRRPGLFPLRRLAGGWFEATCPGVVPGDRYRYLLDGDRERPDPASRAQPDGVHGPSEVVDPAAFRWSDAGWRGRPLAEMVMYELHVGSFTPGGTFEAIIPRLPRLRELGVTTLELMPVASFPGVRNWGYDGVSLFAPQRSYGGPRGLRRLVDACHAAGLAVVLDVVYNHLGPEGNYLAEFGPYFTDRHTTPWGDAVNYDGEDSRPVRDFVIANACRWVEEYHIDGLRLDAIHGIFDTGPVHILRELNAAVQRLARRLGRLVPVIAESDLNDRRVVAPIRKGGYGLAGQWSDDFHHCLHTLLTGERHGYYADFGSLAQLAKAYTDGFVYDGGRSPSRGRPHGTPSRDLPAERFVVSAQNHDQVGNRPRGERLASLVEWEALKLAAAALLLSPNVPLLFMGEEYGEQAPFLYFTDFADRGLQEAVTRGRRAECAALGWSEEIPDPGTPGSFDRSRLDWMRQRREPHARLRAFYRELLRLRRDHPALGAGGKSRLWVRERPAERLLLLRRDGPGSVAVAALNFSPRPQRLHLPLPRGTWRRLLDGAEERFGGAGARSPRELASSGSDRAEVELTGYGVVLYGRDGPARPGVRRVRPPREERS